MAKKKSKSQTIGLIALAFIVVCLAMTVVGFFLAWTSTTGKTAITESQTTTAKLSELMKTYKDMGENGAKSMKGFSTMYTFAVITLIAMIASGVLAVAGKLVNVKLLKLLGSLMGLATVVCAIVLIATSFSFSGNYDVNFSIGSINLANSKTVPAVGPWFMTVFGVLGGGATAFACMKK